MGKSVFICGQSHEFAHIRSFNRAVVQLGRTLEWGSRGRGFESRRPDVLYSSARRGVPWILVHSETFSNRADATRRDDIIKEVVVATNLINYNVRTVAAATGRGFESRRPDFQV